MLRENGSLNKCLMRAYTSLAHGCRISCLPTDDGDRAPPEDCRLHRSTAARRFDPTPSVRPAWARCKSGASPRRRTRHRDMTTTTTRGQRREGNRAAGGRLEQTGGQMNNAAHEPQPEATAEGCWALCAGSTRIPVDQTAATSSLVFASTVRMISWMD